MDGTVTWADKVQEGQVIKRSRKVPTRSVYWYKINAMEILEERRLPGNFIPVVTMQGHEYIVGDRRISMSLTRTMRDAQRMYNIARSGAVECVLLAPRAPWIVWEGQTEGHEYEWKWANVRNMSVLTVKPVVGPNGELLPAPTRNTWEAPIQSMTMLMGQADNDMKATSGIYDASLGEKNSVDRSGKAINALQQQGSTATFSYSDAGAHGIQHAGRVLLGMIPEVYDAPRVIRIMKPDGTAQMTPINQHFQLVAGPDGTIQHKLLDQELPGLSKIYDLSVGKYDLVLDMGPSFKTRRQEAFALLTDLAKAFPQIMQVAGDIIAANWDAPFAQELSKRLKFLLPPAIAQAEQQAAGQQAIDPQVVAQQQATIQQLMGQLQAVTQVLREKKIEADGKLRQTMITAIAGIIEAEIKAGSASADTLAKLNFDAVGRMVDAMMAAQQAEQEDQQLEQGNQGSPAPQASPAPPLAGAPNAPTAPATAIPPGPPGPGPT